MICICIYIYNDTHIKKYIYICISTHMICICIYIYMRLNSMIIFIRK